MQKYCFSEEDTIETDGHVLHWIKALRDIPYANVGAGDFGGWIEKEENLSQVGDAWVSEHASVYDDAWVYGDAQIRGNARVYGRAQVYNRARIFDDVRVYDDAIVYEDAIISGAARVYGSARIHGDADIEDGDWSSCDHCGTLYDEF